jgi:plasmid stabilization system protein ParE
VIRLTSRARAQIESLTSHYVELDRDDAVRNLQAAVSTAADRISSQKGPFFATPRPYPSIARPGWRWLKAGSYWIAFGQADGDYVVHALFHETANIPGRMPR